LRALALEEKKTIAAIVREAIDARLHVDNRIAGASLSRGGGVALQERPEDLVSVSEIASRSGRSINTIQSWRRRDRGFPEPVVILAAGPIWDWETVARWMRDRNAGRFRGPRALSVAVDSRLPGADLVRKGLADLSAGRESVESLLLQAAPERLSDVGIVIVGPIGHPPPTDRLYERLVNEVGVSAAHSRYNALRRRLVSFLNAAGASRAPAV
jgi:hypothetical protein